jgi:type VI secretion system protein VasD
MLSPPDHFGVSRRWPRRHGSASSDPQSAAGDRPRPFLTRRAALLGPLLLLTRCGSSPPPPPVLDLTIQAGRDQNPDPAGQPTAVAIRVYQLASPDSFNRADVFALIDRQAETLGADGLGSDEFLLAPGERRQITRDLKPGTRAVGAIALFRQIDQAAWRVSAPAEANGPTRLVLSTAGLKITVSQS